MKKLKIIITSQDTTFICTSLVNKSKTERRKKKEKGVWGVGRRNKEEKRWGKKEEEGGGGKERRKKGGGKEGVGKMRGNAPTRLETIVIVVFLVIILVNTCSFFCTPIASLQV